MSIVNGNPAIADDVIAAFDVGSNSIKMTVARRGAHPGEEMTEFLWRSETVRLGQGVDQSGELAADRIEAALDTLVRFASEARSNGATRLIGVATEATRIASNGEDFLRGVTESTGIELQSISGDREAALTFQGLQGVVDLERSVAVADIGGGSTEIIIAVDGRIMWSQSLPIGSGRLTDRHVLTNPPHRDELIACRDEVREAIAETPLDSIDNGRLIIVGGTGEYLSKLVPEGVAPAPIVLDAVLDRLVTIPSTELATLISIPEARARVLPAGIAAAAAIADRMHPREFASAQSGIRRGLLIAAFAGDL